MSDPIFIVDPATGKLARVEPASFSAINVREREHLEEWVTTYPDVLGEALLPIGKEFNHFDKSNRRLDILALDVNATLVIVELKLDIAGSLADQQAIRYAAFFSNTTMEDVVKMRARLKNCTEDEARLHISEFLNDEELPELVNQPRIILAAGSLEDQELTSTVLWLRRFGVDITCVELTPYRFAEANRIILVPRVIIPLPETSEFQIRTEQKEVTRTRSRQTLLERGPFWKSVADQFNALEVKSGDMLFKMRPTETRKSSYKPLRFGKAHIHYEWAIRKTDGFLDVCVHFESDDRSTNLSWLEAVQRNESVIKKGIEFDFDAEPWGRVWAQARFRIPFSGNYQSPEAAKEAARIMKLLVERTYPLIKDLDE